MDYKPFDLEKAKAGEPIITREGESATFVAYIPECASGHRLIVYIHGRETTTDYFDSGKFLNGGENLLDLFMAPKKIKRWVNVFSEERYVAYTTAEQAAVYDTCAMDSAKRIACIEVEFEEGQGL